MRQSKFHEHQLRSGAGTLVNRVRSGRQPRAALPGGSAPCPACLTAVATWQYISKSTTRQQDVEPRQGRRTRLSRNFMLPGWKAAAAAASSTRLPPPAAPASTCRAGSTTAGGDAAAVDSKQDIRLKQARGLCLIEICKKLGSKPRGRAARKWLGLRSAIGQGTQPPARQNGDLRALLAAHSAVSATR